MKFLALILLFVAFVCADEWKVRSQEELEDSRGVCAQKLKIPDDVFANFKAWKFSDDDLGRAYVACAFESLGLFSRETGFYKDRLVSQFKTTHNKDLTEAIERCAGRTPEDVTPDYWAYRAFRCFYSK